MGLWLSSYSLRPLDEDASMVLEELDAKNALDNAVDDELIAKIVPELLAGVIAELEIGAFAEELAAPIALELVGAAVESFWAGAGAVVLPELKGAEADDEDFVLIEAGLLELVAVCAELYEPEFCVLSVDAELSRSSAKKS